MKLLEVQDELRSLANSADAEHALRYFKTGAGEYGEGDEFLGIRVPVLRKQAKAFREMPLTDTVRLLHSKYHEERHCALFILVQKFERGSTAEKASIYKLYLDNTAYINNWDLVDGSAYQIVGKYLADSDKKPLFRLAKSTSLWERRIAIISTYWYIKSELFDDTLRISEILLKDQEDLIHKAVGWMLREVGNRDLVTEEKFLKRHYKKMPRTMLRYAIEKFPAAKRKTYLRGTA